MTWRWSLVRGPPPIQPMSIIPPLHAAYYYLDHLRSEEADLNASLYELNRALQSPWPDDLPRTVHELLPILNSYIGLVRTIARNLEEAAKEPEEADSQLEKQIR
jgi:hypothetical protein